MRIASVINLKGGVGKTMGAINIAHILAEVHGKRVLLVDNDKQGSVSRFFGAHSYNAPSIADVLTTKGYNVEDAVQPWLKISPPGWLDILPANMMLLRAEKEILLDCSRPQQTRLKRALQSVEQMYDFAIIDCAPDLNMSAINALVASDDVLIPIKVDSFAFDGVKQILETVEELREFNPAIRVVGGFVTMWQKNNVNTQGEAWLQERGGLPMFETAIRKTVAVDETTFKRLPLLAHKKNSTAARDYLALVEEYLKMC